MAIPPVPFLATRSGCVCLSVYLPVCLSTCLSVCLYACMHACMYAGRYVCIYIYIAHNSIHTHTQRHTKTNIEPTHVPFKKGKLGLRPQFVFVGVLHTSLHTARSPRPRSQVRLASGTPLLHCAVHLIEKANIVESQRN